MLTTLQNSFIAILILGFLYGAPAKAQSFVSCKHIKLTAQTEMTDYSYFYTGLGLDHVRLMTLNSLQILSDFQNARAQEILQLSEVLKQDNDSTRAYLNQYTELNRSFRIAFALGFRPLMSPLGHIDTDYAKMVNTSLDASYFRALPKANISPLTAQETEIAASMIKMFLKLEVEYFAKLLAREIKNGFNKPEWLQLLKKLNAQEPLEKKLSIQSKIFQSYMMDKLREFGNQQSEMAYQLLFQNPPLAYTVKKTQVTNTEFQSAIGQVIRNGNAEVTRIRESLAPWTDKNQFIEMKSKVEKRLGNHKRVTVAQALQALAPLFEYIPAVEQALLKNEKSCEAAERAIAIHFQKLSSDQIASMVLMVGLIAVSPFMLGTPLLLVGVGSGLALSAYEMNETQKEYQRVVQDALTEVANENLDPAILADLKSLEASITTQAILFPTMLSGMGYGLKQMLPLMSLRKKLLPLAL